MNSRHLAKLENLLNANNSASDPDVKVALGRLRSEITDRIKKGSPNSVDFLCSSVRALSRLRGPGNADVRLSCLGDVGMFLVTQGYAAQALPALAALDSLALQAQHRLWARRASLLAGL